MFRRNLGRTHGQQVRSELSDSFGHLRLAAAHVVAGTAGVVAPRADRAGRLAGRAADRAGRVAGRATDRAGRVAGRATDRVVTVAVTPVVTGARTVARRGRRSRALQMVTPRRWRGATGMNREFAGMTGKRWSMVIGGLVAAGAVAGAATALVRRRRAADAAMLAGAESSMTDEQPGAPTADERPVADAAVGLGTDAPTDAGHGPVVAAIDDRPGTATAADARDRTTDLIGTRKPR